jgi:tripartite-type tricarboxylate transporter receptor subunit TctC
MRRILLGALAALVLSGGAALAQAWPERPITFVQGFGAGGNADTIDRVIAAPLLAALYRALRFDPVEDFAFVSTVAVFPFVVATRADGPTRSLPELIEQGRRPPGTLTLSSVGIGSTQHLTGELLAQTAGIRLTHEP